MSGATLMFLAPRLLEGAHVRLEPLRPDHRAEMRRVLESDPDNWLMQTVSAVGPHFEAYWG